MQLSAILIILGVAVVAHAQMDSPKGLHFVGVGYNLLEGNPDGGDVSNGGVDPGLLFTRKIFKLTWKTNKVSVDKKYIVPDQVSFAPRASCVTTNKKEVFSGSKSYQEKLNVDVDVSGFKPGWIKWDDQDSRNKNKFSGQLPDGRYDKNAQIEFCCRSDGHATNAIILPTDSPFVMLKSNTHLCQHVKGMKVRSEYFHWDCEDVFPSNKAGGYRPYAYVGKNIKIDYCYYYK